MRACACLTVDGGGAISHTWVRGVGSDSSSLDNEALAANVLLPGTPQGHNVLQMLQAAVQPVAAEGGVSARKAARSGPAGKQPHAPPATGQLRISSAQLSCWQLWSNVGDNIWAQINEISLFQRAGLKIYLFRAIMHNSRTWGVGAKADKTCTHTHICRHMEEGLMNSI